MAEATEGEMEVEALVSVARGEEGAQTEATETRGDMRSHGCNGLAEIKAHCRHGGGGRRYPRGRGGQRGGGRGGWRGGEWGEGGREGERVAEASEQGSAVSLEAAMLCEGIALLCAEGGHGILQGGQLHPSICHELNEA